MRSRLQRAETAQWKYILVEYLAAIQARDERADGLRARDAPPAGDDDATYARVIEQVTSDGVSRSKHTLLRVPRPERSQDTAEARRHYAVSPSPRTSLSDLRKSSTPPTRQSHAFANRSYGR